MQIRAAVAAAKSEPFSIETLEFHRQGRFPFDRLIRFYPLDQINQAAEDLAGRADHEARSAARVAGSALGPPTSRAAPRRGPRVHS